MFKITKSTKKLKLPKFPFATESENDGLYLYMRGSGCVRCLDLNTGYLTDDEYVSIEEVFKINFTEKEVDIELILTPREE